MRHAPTIIVLALLFLLPVIVLILQAGAPGWRFPELWPELTFDGLRFLAARPGPFLTALASSLGYSLATVAVTLAMTFLPAQVLAFRTFPGKNLLEGLLLLPALVPAMTFSMGLHFIFIKFGLADTTPGVILVLAMISYPYMLRALTTGYTLMGREYAVCASNLGASKRRVFLEVELPQLLPAMAAGASVVFLVALSEYFLVFLIGGGSVASFTGNLFPLITSSNRGLGALITMVFLAVPIVLFIALELGLYRYHRKRWMR